ncbi:MAG: DUF302 domain-containing protein [Sedimentisphaerales bacterium]|nr:DUF302 domain-containing protein [Sedimentisphaerales bacterium]
MNDQETKTTNLYGLKALILSSSAGLAVGAVLCGVIIWTLMPSMMILTKESKLGFDETVAALEASIKANGWVVSNTIDMNQSMAKHGVEFKPRVKLVKLCKAEYAQSVLATDRHISTMMPCTFGVWEGDDGKIYVSKMNMGLMAKMFGGNIAEVMGGHVAEDEEKILEGLLKD